MNYISRGGDMNIDTQRFNNIVSSAGALIGTGFVTISGVQYLSRTFSFYQNEYYNKALGVATLYYDSNNNAVGLWDLYDFDPKPWGERSFQAEMETRAASLLPGQGYYIQYGIHP
jgi:hypothetical protein